jgi:hypothetical protein
MVRFGIRAPYEQTSPTDLLNEVVMMSDMVWRSAGQAVIICPGSTLGPQAPLGLGLEQRLPK